MTGRWLVTGGRGMLGRAVAAELERRGIPATITGRDQLDITDPAAVTIAAGTHAVIINAAAWTAVDAAEDHEAEATAVNGTAVWHLAAACEAAGTPLIHLSTDYVFGRRIGELRPWRETDIPAPLSAYGRSKLVGEQAVQRAAPTRGHVVRTAWLYDTTGRNFVTTILRLAAERDRIDVVHDQYGQPTWARVLAGRLVDLGQAATAGRVPAGILHATATASGGVSWYGLARACLDAAGYDPRRIRPVDTAGYPLPATRPPYSVLSGERWAASGMTPLGHWRPMIAEAVKTMQETAIGGTQ